MKSLNEFLNEAKRKIKPFNKVKKGDTGTDTTGEEVIVVATGSVEDLLDYDDSGIAKEGIDDGYIDPNEDAIAVEFPKKRGFSGTAVWTYDEGGAVVYEGRNIQVKRKYGIHDSISVGANAPVRNTILGFVNEKGCCTRDELVEFIKAKNEESGATTNTSWLNKNAKYLKKGTNAVGQTTYKLSKLGQRVISATTISE